MADVFISYKREEREAVQIIADKLAALGVEVWFDVGLKSEGSFGSQIAFQLSAAKAVLVCWTPGAIASEWVRAEGTQAHEADKYVACFLEPTSLIAPFNLVQTEDLSAWAGQPFDPAWLKLLERIGALIGRSGLATYDAMMRPSTTPQELRAWANENGDDPLVGKVRERLEALEGETNTDRTEREKREARERAREHRRQEARSSERKRQRGIRDPQLQQRRWRTLGIGVSAAVLAFLVWIAYSYDAGRRQETLDGLEQPAEVAAFAASNWWHPVSYDALDKLRRLDAVKWEGARSDGSLEALTSYVSDTEMYLAEHGVAETPNLAAARAARDHAAKVADAQRRLARISLYDGPIHGRSDADTIAAIKLFRYRSVLSVSDAVDDPEFDSALDAAVERWISPAPEELRSDNPHPLTEADLVALSERLGVTGPVLLAILDVESSTDGFDAEGRARILFERHIFSRETSGRYDAVAPDVSSRKLGGWGKNNSERWDFLTRAFALDPEAAYKSASYGLTQIAGYNFEQLGFETVGEFVRQMSVSERSQLEAGIGFIESNKLQNLLIKGDWSGFARRYSGSPRQAEKLAGAYSTRREEFKQRPPWLATRARK